MVVIETHTKMGISQPKLSDFHSVKRILAFKAKNIMAALSDENIGSAILVERGCSIRANMIYSSGSTGSVGIDCFLFVSVPKMSEPF